MVVLGVHRYGTSFLPISFEKAGFVGPVGPPLCTNGSQMYLMHFKVLTKMLPIANVLNNFN